MTVDRAGSIERLTAAFWLAAVSFVAAVVIVLSWLFIASIAAPMRRGGPSDWLPVVLLPAPLIAGVIGLRYFCGHLYRREADLRPGLPAHLRHCALLYPALGLIGWRWVECTSTRCADDFGFGIATSAVLLLGVVADGWAWLHWRRAPSVGAAISGAHDAPLPSDR